MFKFCMQANCSPCGSKFWGPVGQLMMETLVPTYRLSADGVGDTMPLLLSCYALRITHSHTLAQTTQTSQYTEESYVTMWAPKAPKNINCTSLHTSNSHVLDLQRHIEEKTHSVLLYNTDKYTHVRDLKKGVMTPACKIHRRADRNLSIVTWMMTLER